jgi:hypothetical protein
MTNLDGAPRIGTGHFPDTGLRGDDSCLKSDYMLTRPDPVLPISPFRAKAAAPRTQYQSHRRLSRPCHPFAVKGRFVARKRRIRDFKDGEQSPAPCWKDRYLATQA